MQGRSLAGLQHCWPSHHGQTPVKALPQLCECTPGVHPATGVHKAGRKLGHLRLLGRCDALQQADIPQVSHAVASGSPPHSRTVAVDLEDRSYPIEIGAGLLDDGARIAAHISGRTALVVTNTTVAPLYLDRCAGSQKLVLAEPCFEVSDWWCALQAAERLEGCRTRAEG